MGHVAARRSPEEVLRDLRRRRLVTTGADALSGGRNLLRLRWSGYLAAAADLLDEVLPQLAEAMDADAETAHHRAKGYAASHPEHVRLKAHGDAWAAAAEMLRALVGGR